MKVKIKTEALKVATAKAIKGAGNLSMLAVTSAIGIEVVGTDLFLTTTDNTTNLKVSVKNVLTEPIEGFYACTNADLFCKLISKQTCDNVILDLQSNVLQITGDGMYNLPLIVDEEGTIVHISPIDVDGLAPVQIEVSELKKVLKYNKLAVSKLYDEPMYTGYCISENKVYTYNGNDACITEVNLENIKLLLPATIINLIELFEDKTVTFLSASDRVKISSADVEITGTVLEGFDNYPIKPLADTVYSTQFTKSVLVKKDKLNAILDRLSLFVSNDEQNALQLNFTEKALLLANGDSNACESLPYVGDSAAEVCAVFIDLNDLKIIANAIDTADIKIIYGNDSAIGVCADKMRFILPLLSDESEELETDEDEEMDLENEEGEETDGD